MVNYEKKILYISSRHPSKKNPLLLPTTGGIKNDAG